MDLAAAAHHRASGLLLLGLIAFGGLYVALRTGRLRRLRMGMRATRVRQDLRGVRVGPLSLLPLAVLVAVVVVLLIAHR